MSARVWFCTVLGLVAAVSSARADVFVEHWDDTGAMHNHWQYWGPGTNEGTRPAAAGQNHDMFWSATGGVDRGGYVWSQSADWLGLWDRLWPAYMAPPDNVAPVNLADQRLAISVNDLGTVAGLPGAIDPKLHFFIGQWLVNGDDPADDTYVFFQHDAAIAVGDNVWARTEFDLGGDDHWSVIFADPGNTKTPSDLYTNPQQWGFVLDHPSLPDGIQLGFDELYVVPEPSGLVLMGLAMLGVAFCGWRCRARGNRR